MEKTKILLIQQDQKDHIMVLQVLADQNVDLFQAKSIDHAFQLLSQEEIVLILLDFQSEGWGVSFIRMLRETEHWNEVPVIFITDDHPPSMPPVISSKLGVSDFISKALIPVVLKHKIKVFSELKRKDRLLKRSVYELIQLKTQAQEATRKRNEFLSNMSHEIRTPLSAVIGFSEVISNPNLSEADRKKVRTAITSHGLQLMRLIDGFLDFSKLEENQFELKIGKFSLFHLFEDMELNLKQKANDKGVHLSFHGDAIPRDLSLLGDSHCIRQVLMNIIGNAIKFTSDGNVRVTAFTLQEKRYNGEAHWNTTVIVEDEGTGIDADFIASLFTPFVQSDSTTRKKFSGTGLGLAISQRMMRLMGGDVRLVSSESSRGSVFEVTFRLEQARDKKALPRMAPTDVSESHSLAGKSILAVDDSPDNLELLEYVLSDCNVNLICVTSGHEAFQMVQRNQFDLILMDIQMPVIDGYETTKKIREYGFAGPIVALTAHVVKHEIEKCYQSGCDGVIGKPYTRGDLLRKISHHISEHSPKVPQL